MNSDPWLTILGPLIEWKAKQSSRRDVKATIKTYPLIAIEIRLVEKTGNKLPLVERYVTFAIMLEQILTGSLEEVRYSTEQAIKELESLFE